MADWKIKNVKKHCAEKSTSQITIPDINLVFSVSMTTRLAQGLHRQQKKIKIKARKGFWKLSIIYCASVIAIKFWSDERIYLRLQREKDLRLKNICTTKILQSWSSKVLFFCSVNKDFTMYTENHKETTEHCKTLWWLCSFNRN